MTACDDCLRRGHLVGFLAPRLTGLLGRPGARRPGLLGLPDAELVEEVCGRGESAAQARTFLERFDAVGARSALAVAGVSAVCRHGAAYPPGLAQLHDPPSVLFVAGRADRLGTISGAACVTVVGTRRASSYGLDMARAIGRELACAGVGVISGLALGIDAAAHAGACEADPTQALAVVACGPEIPYPRSNERLHRRIRESGCIVSELPPGTRVQRWAFPARNRIMAALGPLTVVVEAAEPSGSLITANFALQLHREVAAVPGLATAQHARGTNVLIRDGARMILGPEDVFAALAELGHEIGARPGPSPPGAELGERLRAVLSAVERCDGHAGVADLTGLDPGSLRAALGELELMGLIRRDGFGGYIRAAS